MSADIANLSLIQDEDALRKLWQNTDDFGKKKEIRSQMYKLREQRLKEFYNTGEITETKTTKSSGKVSHSSTHADSIMEQNLRNLKNMEVKNYESPSRNLQYNVPENNEWQISSNNQISKDGKTKICQTLAAVQGTQKLDGGQLDFKARSEQTSSVYQDANTKAVSNKFSASESASSHVVSSKTIPGDQIELPTNTKGVTKITKETKTLPDGSVVITTKYNTEGGASETRAQSSQVKTSQTSSSSRTVNQNQSSSEFTQSGTPSEIIATITCSSKPATDSTVVSTSKYDKGITQSSLHQSSTQNSQVKSSQQTSSSRVVSEKESSYTSGDIPSNLQGVTKVTRETKTLPDGSTVTTTRYDTTSGTSHTEVSGNVQVSKGHTSTSSSSTNQRAEYGTAINVDVNTSRNIDNRIKSDASTEIKNIVTSSGVRGAGNVDQTSSRVTKEHHTKEHVMNRSVTDESDGNKISHTVASTIKQPTDFTTNVTNITSQQQNTTGKTCTDNFVNIERQQEQITRDHKTEDLSTSRPSEKPVSSSTRGRSPTKAPKPEYLPSKPTDGQYNTTYRADFTNKKISVELSPAHDAFARSLRSISPDRIPSRGSHRTSNSSIPEKMRHPSRLSPERHPKDRSVSPNKYDRYSSTDTYISNRRHDEKKRSPSPKRATTRDTFKRTSSNETITLSTTKKAEVTSKSNTDIITKSRSPSPKKTREYLIRSNDIVTDLDDDITVTTTIRETTTSGTRPTSLEFTKKSRKITDRSPSSPLSDLISPKKSPTKEVRRSSSFRSPTKDSPSPKFEEPRRSGNKSPTKDTSPSKSLPEERPPFKRTDTYEERCRQILGIAETTDKRKSSLERSSSKRNSFRRNISSSSVDSTTKSTTETPRSPTKENKITSVASETKVSSVEDRRKTTPSRPSSKDFSTDVNLETIITSDDKSTKKSSITEFPSQRKSPSSRPSSRPSSKDYGYDITLESYKTTDKKSTKKSEITEFPSQRKTPSRPSSRPSSKDFSSDITLETIITTDDRSTKKSEITEFPSQRKTPSRPSSRPSSKDFSNDITLETIITTDDKSTKKSVIGEFPSQRRSPTRGSTEKEEITTSINIQDKVITDDKITKQRPAVTSYPESPTRPRSPSKTTGRRDKIATDEFITQEKLSITKTTCEETSKEKGPDSVEEKPFKKPEVSEFPSQKRYPSKDAVPSDDKPKRKEPSITEFSSQIHRGQDKSETVSKVTTHETADISKPPEDKLKKKPLITEYPSVNKPTKDKDVTKLTTEERITITEKVTNGYEASKQKIPFDRKPSTQRPEITEFPSQKKTPSKETLNVKSDKTVSIEDITKTEQISVNVALTDDSKKEYKPARKEPSLTEFPSQSKPTTKETTKTDTVEKKKSIIKKTSQDDITTDKITVKNIINKDKDVKILDSETIHITKLKDLHPQLAEEKPKKQGPSVSEFPSQIRSPAKEKPQSGKETTNKFITKEKLASDEVTVSKTTKSLPKEPKKISEFPSQIRKNQKISTENKKHTTTATFKVDTEDVTEIIEDIITDETKRGPMITEYPSQKKPSTDETDFADFVVTDEFEINISKSKPLDEKPKKKTPIGEFPAQIRRQPEKRQPVTQQKPTPKEHHSSVKHQITEYPSQTRPDKKPVAKEPQANVKNVQTISYEGKIPVEKPVCIKRHINTDCPEDEHNHHHVVKKVLPSSTTTKKVTKQFSIDKPDKKPETPLTRKPINGITEYTDKYSKPKSIVSPKPKPFKSEEIEKPLKPSNKINIPSAKPTINGLNGVSTKENKIKDTTVYITSVKQHKYPISETIIKKTSSTNLVKEKVSPKPKQVTTEKVTRLTPTRGPAPTTKPKPSQSEQTNKKHLVTTTITLKNGHQPTATKPKVQSPKLTNYEKKTFKLKQQKNLNEVATETDEESVSEDMAETIDVVTRKNVTKVTKKPDKKCITTKTVIINNNEIQAREIIVDLQRSTSSREPTPDRICPVPISRTENGGYQSPRYPDEIIEPDDDSIKRKPKRLSDIPLIEYEDTNNFSRITEIIDSHVITERDKVDHTDESLLSVNRKINLFSDTADKITKDNKKSSGPAPRVDRPKLEVTKDLESDECLLSVSEKVNKFVNTAEQFVNVPDIPDRPKSPRCRFNDSKVASNTFIAKEQKVLEKENRRVSRENIDSKENTRKSSRPSSPEKPKEDVRDYPNYKTITKRISLENMDVRSTTKPQEYRPKSPDRKSPTRTGFTKFESSNKPRDVSPVDKRYKPKENGRPSPEAKSPSRTKSPETPNRRPSNEYTSIKSIKTQERSTRRDSSPEDRTPKTGKTKPIEDKRTVLSSTGRLRSTESIKKAKALFENMSKGQELVRPSSTSPLLDRKITNKETVVRKLSYSSEERDRSRSTSPDKRISTPCSPDIRPENGDTPHYMLPLDRNVRPHSPTSSPSLPESRHENGDIPHYMLPLDRSVRPHSPTSSPSLPDSRHENGDIPHYMLPLDRSIRPHSPHRENVDVDQNVDSRTTKFGVTLRKTPTPGSPTIPTSRSTPSTSKAFIDQRLYNIETLTEEKIQEIFEIEILEEWLQKVTSYEIRRIIRNQIRLVKKLISENRLTIYIEERKQLKANKSYTDSVSQKTDHHSTYSFSERRTSSDTTTKEVRKHSPVRQPSPPRTRSPIRPPSPIRRLNTDDTTIRSTYIVRKSSNPTEITKTEEYKRISPETTTSTYKTTTERTSTTETRQKSPPRPSSPVRKLHPDETITRSTYTVRKSSTDKIPEVTTKKTEEIRKSSPERTSKTTVEHVRKSSTDRTIYTTTERSTRQSQQSTVKETTRGPDRVSPTRKPNQRSPERKTSSPIRKESPSRTSDSRSTYSILKKTEVNKKKVEDSKPEWVTKRNLKKVTPTSSADKVRTTTSSKTVVKQEKYSSSNGCQPTDLITSSYGVGPTDENGSPLFGLKALRTQSNNNNTTKVQGTFISSEYYSENGQEPVGQISVTKYSTDPRDLSIDEQIENNNLITSVTTTQKFGYEDTPTLDTLTTKRLDNRIEDSVLDKDRTSTFKRQNSVKAISQKFIDNTVESLQKEKQTTYPKAGLILRTSSFKDSKNAASNVEDTSTGSITSTKTTKQSTTTKSTSGGSFLSNKSTISGVQDVISRMKTEEYQEGDNSEDTEARNLLNKFLGSQVLLSGMENRASNARTVKTSQISEIVPASTGSTKKTIKITRTTTEGGKTKTKTLVFQTPITEEELANIWDEQTLRLLLDQSTEYEERRIIRNRLKTIMAEQEACADLVEKASQEQSTEKLEETVSVEKSTSETPVATKTQVTKVTTQQQITKKPLSPFAKFKQLDKQNSIGSTPSTPGSPKTPGNGPLFKFTDPAVSQSASTIKERLLFWCKTKTKEYENVQLDNFSSSWADGLAFCALIHHFYPDAFDYHALTPKDRRHNFDLAFKVASDKADIFPLLDVDDMVSVRKPDWKCVFTYVQSIHRRFKNEEI